MMKRIEITVGPNSIANEYTFDPNDVRTVIRALRRASGQMKDFPVEQFALDKLAGLLSETL